MQMAMSVINFVINYLLVFYGGQSAMGSEAALASIGIVQRCSMFTVLPLIGTAVAIQPLLGYNYGAGLIPRVRKTLGFGILVATVIGTCMWVVILLVLGRYRRASSVSVQMHCANSRRLL